MFLSLELCGVSFTGYKCRLSATDYCAMFILFMCYRIYIMNFVWMCLLNGFSTCASIRSANVCSVRDIIEIAWWMISLKNTTSFRKHSLNASFTLLFQQIKAIADSGCKQIVTGGKVGELALHYCNKYNLMVLRLMSKFDLRRLCQTVGATALPRIVSIVICELQQRVVQSS